MFVLILVTSLQRILEHCQVIDLRLPISKKVSAVAFVLTNAARKNLNLCIAIKYELCLRNIFVSFVEILSSKFVVALLFIEISFVT